MKTLKARVLHALDRSFEIYINWTLKALVVAGIVLVLWWLSTITWAVPVRVVP